MAADTRADAVERLEAALAEQTRLGERYRAALGTASEVGAFARLREAGEDVTAQQISLDHFDQNRAGRVKADNPPGLARYARR